MDSLESLRYPIGRFEPAPATSTPDRRPLIGEVERLPERLATAVDGLTAAQLAAPYRPGGWSVRQLVHHVADSHMHAYTRFKRGVTEDEPTLALPDVDGWAGLPDAMELEVPVSLDLLDALHRRWVFFLRAMAPDQFERTLLHPTRGRMTLNATLQLYAWHGRHHVAHITSLRAREGW